MNDRLKHRLGEKLDSFQAETIRLENRFDLELARLMVADLKRLDSEAKEVQTEWSQKLIAAAIEGIERIPPGLSGLPSPVVEAFLDLFVAIGFEWKLTATQVHPEEATQRLRQTIGEIPLPIVESTPTPNSPGTATNWPAPGVIASPELIGPFVNEALENLEEIEAALIDFENQTDHQEAINRLFRSFHSIKGTADYVGLKQIKKLSHQLESVLTLARSGELDLRNGGTDLIFRGVDALKSMIQQITPQGETDHDLAEFVAALAALCSSAKDVPKQQTQETLGVDEEERVYRGTTEQHLGSIHACLVALANGQATPVVLTTLHRSTSSLQTASSTMARSEMSSMAERLLASVDRLTAARTRFLSMKSSSTAVEVVLPTTPVVVTPVAPVRKEPVPVAVAPASKPITPAPPPRVKDAPKSKPVNTETAAIGKAAVKTMRVDQRRMDEYVNLAGELVIARNSLMHSLRQFQANKDAARSLKESVEKVDRIVGDLQNNAMGMRMVPVSTVFQRFPRMVRDIAKTLDKQIELEIHGEETELDKQVAEALGDPLVHLVRNAVDHGVESAADRVASGKSPIGSITLRAGRDGNSIFIEIQDDGAGINADRLKEKAVAAGILTQERANSMSKEEALDLIFAPGLSTAQVVSDLSGRGVGMDVVRSNILALSGSVSVHSDRGKGTCIRLILPLTLAVTTAIIVGAGGETYGLPIDAVRETMKVDPRSLLSLRGVKTIAVRGDIVPILSLDGLLSEEGISAHQHDESPVEYVEGSRVPIVVLSAGGNRFGVIVDELKGQQEIVVKPVPNQLGHIEGIGGATIMGDGSIVLLIDPVSLYRSVQMI